MRTIVFIICVSVLVVRIVYASTCNILSKQDNCVYSVHCQEYSGSVARYTCNYDSQRNVTFIMTGSTVDTLKYGFFRATNFDANVRNIIAKNNTWPIIDSNVFTYYVKTRNVDLSFNKISIINNNAFHDLQMLQTMNLSNNIISDLLPKSLCFISGADFRILDLSNNFLSNLSSGDFFQYMPKLEYLYLNNNMLDTISDNCMFNLGYLSTLMLQNNYLRYLNMTLVNLKNLKHLDVSHNQLLKLSNYEINRLPAIEFINMSSNCIKSVDEGCFMLGLNLHTLDLSNNEIQSDVSHFMFSNNGNLTYLDLHNNNITKIEDKAFENNALLNYFNIEKNNITFDISNHTFLGLEKLQKINLYKQNIVAIRNNSFKHMQNLLVFNASFNNIETIEYSSFTGADAILILDLSHNKINNVFFMEIGFRYLKELYLNSNNISVLPPNILSSLYRLVKLDISINKIVSIEPNVLPLNKLQYLNVVGNNFSGVLTNGTFNNAPFLRNLDLSNNKLNKIDKEALLDMPLLATMNLSHNQIEMIDPENFDNMDNMYSLDLSFNLLNSIQLDRTDIKSLKALYLSNNKISNISMSFVNAINMFYLDLSNNLISDVGHSLVQSFPNLKVLSLSFNEIEIFNTKVLNWSHLTDIRLASNMLSDINLSSYPGLVSVDLSKNNFVTINNAFFGNLYNLESLDMSHNNISELPPGIFKSANILKILNMSSNHISKLRYGSLRGLEAIELLDFSKNKLTELDVHVFHECVKLKKLIIDSNYIKTLNVDKFILIAPKLEMLSIGNNPVACNEVLRHIASGKNNESRRIEITSVDKIYHEDNVHGIKCGDDPTDDVITSTTPKVILVNENSTIFISTLTIVLVVAMSALIVIVIVLLLQRFSRNSGMLHVSTMELDNSSHLTSSHLLD